MKRIIILFFACSISSLSFARQWISFYADLASLSGHAYVSFITDDPIKKQTLVDNWGFYPKNPNELGFISYVQGEIKDDIARQKDIGFMIEVTTTEMQACIKTKDIWVNKKYSLTIRNCVDFLRDIVNTINENRAIGKPRLRQPIGLYVFPSEYVQTLKGLNISLQVSFPLPVAAIDEKNTSSELTPEFIWKSAFPGNTTIIANQLILDNGNRKTELSKQYSYVSNGIPKTIVLFFTYTYSEGRKMDCHACAPAPALVRYMKKNGVWSLEQFEDKDINGLTAAWGQPAAISFIVKNGKQYVVGTGSDMHFGDVQKWKEYYNLENFKNEKIK